MLETCQPPDPNPRSPRLQLPPGTTDCHIHIFGPDSEFPPSPKAKFTVPPALPQSCRHMLDVLGVERVVAVQPSTYGFDNRRQLTALQELGRPARAVVAVPFDIPDRELDQAHEAGARGVRFAIGHSYSPALEDIARFAGRLARLKWHVEFHVVRSGVLAGAQQLMSKFPVDIVIAHFGELQPEHGVCQPDCQALCELVRGGRCWVKLSGAYRLSAEPPYWDITPFARALVELRPDRMVWGTDWPHVNFKGKMPNTTEMLDCLPEWLPDSNVRERILVANPAVLYGF